MKKNICYDCKKEFKYVSELKAHMNLSAHFTKIDRSLYRPV